MNVGSADRLFRLVFGIGLLLVAAFVVEGGLLGSALAIALGVIGLVLIATGLAARCPIYKPFGIDTR